MKKRITPPQGLAEYLDIKLSKVRTLVFEKQVPTIRIGRLLRFDLDEIDRWLETQKSPRSPDLTVVDVPEAKAQNDKNESEGLK